MRRSGRAARRIVFQCVCKRTRRRAAYWRSFILLPGTAIQGRRSDWRISRSVRLLAGANIRREWRTDYRSPGRIGLCSGLPEIIRGLSCNREAAAVGGLFHSRRPITPLPCGWRKHVFRSRRRSQRRKNTAHVHRVTASASSCLHPTSHISKTSMLAGNARP
jgi:hypothetical protein